MEKQRARNPDEKAQRKQSIVDALRGLLEQSPQKMPSAVEITKAAGVSKAVIYIYFKTREEIFLSLFLQLADEFYAELYPVIESESYSIETLRDTFTGFVETNPVFMYLGLIAPSVLEQNVSEAFIREFKHNAADGLHQFATAWRQQEPGLSVEQLRNFILRFFYLSQMLWQHNNPPTAVLNAVDPKINWLLQGDLKQDVNESFDWLWTGLKQLG